MIARALRQQPSVLDIVNTVRGIHAWIDAEIRKGRTDDQIVSMAPLATAFISGDMSVSELERLLAGLADEAAAS